MPDTFKFHANLTETDGLHEPKSHATSHQLLGSDPLDLSVIAFNTSVESQLKTYIDSQIQGENHWDLESDNTLVPYIADANVNLGNGSITAYNLNISNWNAAYGWGGHIGLYDAAGTATGLIETHELTYNHLLIATALQSETDPVFTAWDKSAGISITESQISDLQVYLTVETDPVYISWYNSGSPTLTALTLSSLISGRIACITTGGLLTDNALFTFDGSKLIAPRFVSGTDPYGISSLYIRKVGTATTSTNVSTWFDSVFQPTDDTATGKVYGFVGQGIYENDTGYAAEFNLTSDPLTQLAYNAGGVCGFYGGTAVNSTGTITAIVANSGQNLVRNVSTVTNAIGFLAHSVNMDVGSGATVENAYGLYVKTPRATNITNAYGLYISDQKGGTYPTLAGDNGYGVYQAGASDTNYFAGEVLFNQRTSGRIPYFTTNGKITDDASLTFSPGNMLLSAVGGSNYAAICVSDTLAARSTFQISKYPATQTRGGAFPANPDLQLNIGDDVGAFLFAGQTATGTVSAGAGLFATIDANPTSGHCPTAFYFRTGTNAGDRFIRLALTSSGNVITGTYGAAVLTDATDGFLYIPTCAGTPTGTPTAYTGKVAIVMDTTNHKLYVYDGSWIAMN